MLRSALCLCLALTACNQAPLPPSSGSYAVVVEGTNIWLYDAQQQRVGDLAASLGLDTSYADLRVTGVDAVGWYLRDFSNGPMFQRIEHHARGARRSGDTRVLVRATREESTRIAGIALDGRVTFDRRVDGDWWDISLSPSGRWLLAREERFGMSAIIDAQSGAIRWRDGIESGVFNETDDAFVFSTGLHTPDPFVEIVTLPAGATRIVPLPSELQPDPSSMWRRAFWEARSTRSGVLFQVAGPEGTSLWRLGAGDQWAKMVSDLDTARTPVIVNEGRTLLFKQTTRQGSFAIDLESAALTGELPPYDVMSNDTFYFFDRGQLMRWTLAAAAPQAHGVELSIQPNQAYQVTQASRDGQLFQIAALENTGNAFELKGRSQVQVGVGASWAQRAFGAAVDLPFDSQGQLTLIFDIRGAFALTRRTGEPTAFQPVSPNAFVLDP